MNKRKESVGYLNDKAREFVNSSNEEKNLSSQIDALVEKLSIQRRKTYDIAEILKENGPQVHILDGKPSRIIVIVDTDIVDVKSELR